MDPILDDRALEYTEKALREKEWEPVSEKHKLMMAAGTGMFPLALNRVLNHPMNASLVPKSLLMAAIGYAIPTVINNAMEKGEEERSEYLRNARLQDVFLKKEAALPTFGRATSKVMSGALDVGRDFLKGVVSPLKGKTMGETALSIGSKALVGYGAFSAGKYVVNKTKKPNYVNYLRNQVLAGNVRPEELTQRDLESIKNLGMR
jgi:hypothetical protein